MKKLFSAVCDLISGKGEDATPICTDTAIAVFDGMAGAGGTKCTLSLNGAEPKEYTWAYLASREVRRIVDKLLEGYSKRDIYDKISKDFLHDYIRRELQKYADENNIKENAMIRSKMIKLLPTTMAMVAFSECENWNEYADVYWAGDSRIYFFDQNGLRHLSKDDLNRDNDAFQNILDDAPMSNNIHVSVGGDFHINHARYPLMRGLYIATSDGVFQYLQSPMHLEALIIRAVLNSSDIKGVVEYMMTELKKSQHDDISLAIKHVDVLCGNYAHAEDFASFKKKVNDSHLYAKNGYDLLDNDKIFKANKMFDELRKVFAIACAEACEDISRYNQEIFGLLKAVSKPGDSEVEKICEILLQPVTHLNVGAAIKFAESSLNVCAALQRESNDQSDRAVRLKNEIKVESSKVKNTADSIKDKLERVLETIRNNKLFDMVHSTYKAFSQKCAGIAVEESALLFKHKQPEAELKEKLLFFKDFKNEYDQCYKKKGSEIESMVKLINESFEMYPLLRDNFNDNYNIFLAHLWITIKPEHEKFIKALRQGG